MPRCALVIALVAVLTPAFAQIDPAARPFLAGTEAARPRFAVRALDYTICITVHEGEAADAESCIRSAIDFSGRRLLAETKSRFGEDEVRTKIVYVDGQARVTGFMDDEPVVLPKAQAALFEQMFRYAADLAQTGGSLPETYSRATYDGPVRYGNVVRGEQVTAEALMPGFTTGAAKPQPTTLRLIFGSDKTLLAVLSTATPEHTLQVFENPADPILLRRMIDGETYRLRNGTPVLSGSQRLTRYRLNPELPDALFTFGSGAAAGATSPEKTAPAKTPR